jgi:Spy/CpxP family protein refolding chaperone
MVLKKGIWLTLIAAVLIMVIGSTVLAGDKGFCRRQGHHRRLIARLRLTPEQQSKILEIRQNNEQETLALRQELQRKRLELKKLWSEEYPQEDKIVALMTDMVPTQVKLRLKARSLQEEIKQVLTPKQLKRYEQLKKEQGRDRRFVRHSKKRWVKKTSTNN